ncbi:mitochondrial RNA binding protein [Trypanosoma cruzi]|nr:mitochondrial RNA binding protein [Trypanosoma cruzi]
MMRRSRPCGVVFTPAMPHLEGFLSRHVRPDHPLRHHPMWLSESDLSNCPNWKFDATSVQNSGEMRMAKNMPMVVAQVPMSLDLFNMDQLLPESEAHWQLPIATAATSVSSMRPYEGQAQRQLEHRRMTCGFESNWWGTRSQWRKRGCHLDPKAVPSVLAFHKMTRLVHISMFSGGKEMLNDYFVSGKTGILRQLSASNELSQLAVNFCFLVKTHFERHGFQSPLYFSRPSLRSARIAIRPDAEPLDLSPLDEYEYNGPGAMAHTSHDVEVYTQYYHLSQVIFPENYRIPPNVLEAERENPGVPINGKTGEVLKIPELQYEAILNSPSPELASLIARDHESEPADSFSELESPKTVRGRSLWYLPHDLLETGGLVDVNSVPVEVMGGQEGQKKLWRLLYNVEQLLLPVEGYKAVGRIGWMAQPAGKQLSDFSDGNADAVTGVGGEPNFPF